MGAKTLRFIYCVEILALFAAPVAWAQQSNTPTPTAAATGTPTPTFTVAVTNTDTSTDTPTGTPTVTFTSTYTWNPFATPTWTFTWNPYATDTPTPGSPTATPTVTYTFTPTVTGTIPTNTPTMTNTPSISRASLALWPTAYSNAWDRWDGFNWDIAFTYLIGTIAEKDNSNPNVDWLNPLRLWLLTSDLKYGWLDENGDTPAFASGLLMTELLNGGTPGAAGQASSSFQLNGYSMGGVYTVMSKSVGLDSAVHFGYIYGFNQAFQKISLGGFAPCMTYSQLVPLTSTKLSNDLQNDQNTSPPNIFYTGFNTRMLGTNWKFEIWKPFPMDENPVLLDSQIDGLFAFNLGYERWDHGFAVLGYFNFRFTIIPVPPPY